MEIVRQNSAKTGFEPTTLDTEHTRPIMNELFMFDLDGVITVPVQISSCHGQSDDDL